MKPNHIRLLGATLALSSVFCSQAIAEHQPMLQYETEEIHSVRQGDMIYAGFRDLCEAAGYTVSWKDGAAIAAGEKEIIVVPDTSYVCVDKTCYETSGDILLVDGKTVLPVRDLANVLNMTVAYESTSGTAVLHTSTDNVVLPEPLPKPEQTPSLETAPQGYSDTDLLWLARIIEAEAGGESAEGKLAVGNVVLNRVNDPNYPDTVYEVIFDTKYGTQFEPTSNGTIYNTPSQESYDAAKRALEGQNVVGEAIYFYNPSLVDAVWIRTNCTYLQTIGCHDFFV